ncbi:MAG TPA: histidine phosphatase family protein [Thermoanaerobaculales bacterium]|nr:histidine phosphatase family protein [Thermoanaerobaculales bacterium]HQL29464.1 histidine phosphatase family protein [Thermoanaerobaculales bacterium]HQP42726.1 histidine phosphatase family protein [Thermoanaerobaculales bacterium]
MDEIKELWLVRHGETTASAGRRIAGWSDPPLTDVGRRQAEAVRASLDGNPFDSVWSSDLDRAVSSARLAWGEPQVDRRLREVHFGPFEGRDYDEVDGGLTDVFMVFRGFEIPGGESHAQFRQRVHGFVDELQAGRHLLFVHGGVIRILTQDLGLDRFVATGSLVVVDWTARRLLEVRER